MPAMIAPARSRPSWPAPVRRLSGAPPICFWSPNRQASGSARDLAGLPGPDAGAGFDSGPAHARLDAAGHPTPLWNVETDSDNAVYVGEAKAAWMWVILWPAEAGVLLVENLGLEDAVGHDGSIDVAYGALMPRLAAMVGSDRP